ncbi:hypothetical protein DFR30_0082 [Thiogranum longum]|uniref:Uncharacterized protein n=1 Tax=Thiogranum longum TaxID=1537524 RepID=A0A4R1H8T8_9GAMM|nr:hypothetical protein [Thiogranum longum]TCK16863.1 hypothetical protein DFR30_0082 [Thiogranum longum]
MRRCTHLPFPCKQHGAALLLFVIALVMAASYALLKKVNQAPDASARERHTMMQLNQARAALLGYALNGLDPVSATIQPGRMPCPDYDLDGASDNCNIVSGRVQPGRLPWLTLGLSELRDAANEPLWYVPAIEFTGVQPINSNTDTTALRIDGGAEALVAIVLAPGAVLGSQSRPSGNPLAQLDPARYLEDINALAGTNYVSAPSSSATDFNDRLLAIRLDRFMSQLEARVLRKISALLGPGPYPNPAAVGSTACDNTLVEGLLPLTTDPLLTCDAALPVFPNWFASDWQKLVWYVMDPSSSLTVQLADGGLLPGQQTLLFSAGVPLTAIGQPSPRSASPDVLQLLDDSDNTDGVPTYREPVPSLTDNDQLMIVSP